MNKILIVHTSWYKEYVDEMKEISTEIIIKNGFQVESVVAPGSIELAGLGKHKIMESGSSLFKGIFFLGLVIRGETSHYDLVTNETFRSIGTLALEYPHISMINNVICVENKNQLIDRLKKNTKNNSEALISLINEKSS